LTINNKYNHILDKLKLRIMIQKTQKKAFKVRIQINFQKIKRINLMSFSKLIKIKLYNKWEKKKQKKRFKIQLIMSKLLNCCTKQRAQINFKRFAKNMEFNLQKLDKLINATKLAKKFFHILINFNQAH